VIAPENHDCGADNSADDFLMMQSFESFRSHSLTAVLTVLLVVCGTEAMAENGQQLTPHIVSCDVGFDGHYKVGHWMPVHIVVTAGVGDPTDFVIEVEAVDSDGVATIVSKEVTTGASMRAPFTAYTRIGRLSSPIRVRMNANGRVVDERTLRPSSQPDGEAAVTALPANAELIVTFSATRFGFAEAFIDRPASAGMPARRVVQLRSSSDLPDEWIGYESADVLVVSIGDGGLWRELAADADRLNALRRWVASGGKLVVLFGGRAEADRAADAAGRAAFTALAEFLPGRFLNVDRLPQTDAVEHYAQSDVAIAPGMRSELSVVQLENPIGRVELFGQRGATWPLVIREPRGLGEITFVGLDWDVPPLANWPGRTSFLRAVMRPLVVDDEPHEVSRTLVTSGYDDLSGALRQRLGQAFPGVRAVSFRTVVGLSILYLLVLFPLDFLIVHRWLRRPRLAWVTFPLILVLFGAGALVLADSKTSVSGASVNQVELVDVDVPGGRVRGTYWASLYSPESRRFDLQFAARFGADQSTAAESVLTWHGLAGSGIGGMRGSEASFAVISDAYRYASRNHLEGVPVLTAATKSLMARWTSQTSPLIDVQLSDDDGMVAGRLTNRSGMTLRNARLLYGDWAYRLKDIEPGATIEVNEELTPLSVQTLIRTLALGNFGGSSLGSERSSLAIEQATATQLANVIMFHKAAGGAAFSRLPLRYQADCDLSRQLELGRAVLVAEVSAAGSRLIEADSGQPLGDRDADSALTIYRFILPVEKSNQ
jgi:hypothetical protein